MRVLVQRSKISSVSVDDKIVGKIDHGLVLLVGFTNQDTISDIELLVKKVLNLRIFDDEQGVMNRSIIDTEGSILCISQFTLYANCEKGNRPSYIEAMPGKEAKELYDLFCFKLSEKVDVQKGVFGADMEVQITNDGPVTIWLESRSKDAKK